MISARRSVQLENRSLCGMFSVLGPEEQSRPKYHDIPQGQKAWFKFGRASGAQHPCSPVLPHPKADHRPQAESSGVHSASICVCIWPHCKQSSVACDWRPQHLNSSVALSSLIFGWKLFALPGLWVISISIH